MFEKQCRLCTRSTGRRCAYGCLFGARQFQYEPLGTACEQRVNLNISRSEDSAIRSPVHLRLKVTNLKPDNAVTYEQKQLYLILMGHRQAIPIVSLTEQIMWLPMQFSLLLSKCFQQSKKACGQNMRLEDCLRCQQLYIIADKGKDKGHQPQVLPACLVYEELRISQLVMA